MRIKEEIKKSGYFWLPSEPDRKLPGTLSISDGGNIELEVDDIFIAHNDDLKRIVGQIEKDEWVTLDTCYHKKISANLGTPKSLIHVNRAFTGVIYDEGSLPLFNTLTFSVEGINEWIRIADISVGGQLEERTVTIDGRTVTIPYQQPAEISLNLRNGMMLLIAFCQVCSSEFSTTKKIRITSKIYFKLVSQEARELDEFIPVAQKITTFLCFAINEIVCLDSMSATADSSHRDTGEGTTRMSPTNIYYSSQPYSKDKPRIHRHDMLFRFEKIQKNAEEVINKWIEQTTPAFDLYFWTQMRTQLYSDVRFLTLAQGLEVYHRRTSDEKQMDEAEFKELIDNLIDQCPQERKEWLKGKLQYANEVSLRHRLRNLIEPFEEVIGDKKKQRRLINRIVKTRNYLTHYDQSLESEVAGENLEFLCLKMELLFQLNFLRLIGFSKEQINSILANCSQIQRKLQ